MGVSPRRFSFPSDALDRRFMHAIAITDIEDPRLHPYRQLKHEDTSKRGGNFIAEGRLLVRRLLVSDYEAISVLAEPARLPELEPLVNSELPVFIVSAEQMRRITGFNFHRGLLACGKRRAILPMESLDHFVAADAMSLVALSINDVENLGSLIRTAAAFGIFNLVLNRATADPLCRRVLRVSMGAALKMKYFDLTDPQAWFAANERSRQWLTIAMTLADDSLAIDAMDSLEEGPKMLVLGNEADGIPDAIQRACTQRVKIPMAEGIDSLNVAVAGAIAIYEFQRRKPRLSDR